MLKKKTIACIMPARLHSTRFKKKVLSSLCGKPLLQWVWEATTKINYFDHTYFAIDSEETAQLIESFGGQYIMTSKQCPSGTDRLIEILLSNKLHADIWINWQADEPFISKKLIDDLLQDIDKSHIDIWTLKKRINNQQAIINPNVVKVVCDTSNNALYFSRSPIPFCQNVHYKKNISYFYHIGLYAFTHSSLKTIANIPTHHLENAENLEQLRFLAHNLTIRTNETDTDVIGINHPEDVNLAEQYIKKYYYGNKSQYQKA